MEEYKCNQLYGALLHLRTPLSKNENVKRVMYVDSSKLNNIYRQCIRKNVINYHSVLMSIDSNIEMLQTIEIDEEFENSATKNVYNAFLEIQTFINDEALISELLKYEDCKILMVEVASMLNVFSVTFRETRTISKLIDYDLNNVRNIGENTFYRGHSNYSYELIPSIYRNISIDGLSVVNCVSLRNLYNESMILPKYKTVFGDSMIDYDFCAFAQHSCAYSPFLDFTADIKVALSFATSKIGAINSYLNSDASLFTISFNDDIKVLDRINLDDLDMVVYENKLNAFTTIRKKFLCTCTWEDFYVEAFILEDKTNDRMKYQRGCFLYIKRGIIVNGILLLPVNYGRIRKYRIPSVGKTITKNYIAKTVAEKYPWYKYDYLMNPYRYFEEAPL